MDKKNGDSKSTVQFKKQMNKHAQRKEFTQAKRKNKEAKNNAIGGF